MSLPDFIICGAMKAGSSALKRMISQHPDVWTPRGETHFFDRNYHQGIQTYKKIFKASKLTGEKTPYYMSDPRIMSRIAKHAPKAKLLVVLRDPVVRIISQRDHDGRIFRVGKLPLQEYLDHDLFGPDALWRGQYHAQLCYMQMMPNEVCVVIGEELREQPNRAMKRVHEFLGLEHVPVKLAKVKPHRKVVDDTRWLESYYYEHNLKLFDELQNPLILNWKGMENARASILGGRETVADPSVRDDDRETNRNEGEALELYGSTSGSTELAEASAPSS